jgi:uncharacterized membrane protein
MFLRLLAALILLALPAAAQDFPALHRVTGVSAGDVLNIRAEPSARSAIVGSFPRDAAGIEVIGLSEDRTWGLVRTAEGAGWSNMRFLTREHADAWHAGTHHLTCLGTEPFWSMAFFLPGNRAEFVAPDDSWEVRTDAPNLPHTAFPPTLALPFSGAREGVAVIRNGVCSDGMSDRVFGLETQVYFRGDARGLTGCCHLGH